ncbi:hypothetical protein FQR65_LT20958 [Abscondita terminalis]|nr:hypothetical protein FQR65_LT20958 [Abscondita terminalis]
MRTRSDRNSEAAAKTSNMQFDINFSVGGRFKIGEFITLKPHDHALFHTELNVRAYPSENWFGLRYRISNQYYTFAADRRNAVRTRRGVASRGLARVVRDDEAEDHGPIRPNPPTYLLSTLTAFCLVVKVQQLVSLTSSPAASDTKHVERTG